MSLVLAGLFCHFWRWNACYIFLFGWILFVAIWCPRVGHQVTVVLGG